jgi:hypothetical protein
MVIGTRVLTCQGALVIVDTHYQVQTPAAHSTVFALALTSCIEVHMILFLRLRDTQGVLQQHPLGFVVQGKSGLVHGWAEPPRQAHLNWLPHHRSRQQRLSS